VGVDTGHLCPPVRPPSNNVAHIGKTREHADLTDNKGGSITKTDRLIYRTAAPPTHPLLMLSTDAVETAPDGSATAVGGEQLGKQAHWSGTKEVGDNAVARDILSPLWCCDLSVTPPYLSVSHLTITPGLATARCLCCCL